jgi:uncharacterized protein (TIGR02679 family)
LCGGSCTGANLGPLLDPNLTWLWEQIGRAADRRGTAALDEGSLSVRVPHAAEARAAAAGLLGGRVLRGGQTCSVKLGQLMQKLQVRGQRLTPGAVAAHALGRPLAVRAAVDVQRRQREHQMLSVFLELTRSTSREAFVRPQAIWAGLRRSGWIARLLTAEDADRLLRSALAVIERLPPPGVHADRRTLATAVTGNPHALDQGSALAGLTMALLIAAERIKPRQRTRDAWAALGVDCDDLVGGLIALGILPADWILPRGTPVTLPPRVLNVCQWPLPTSSSCVFVTENPSIVSAAADLAAQRDGIRLLCTSGTPSAIEIAAIARLAHQGWNVAVRADFDSAGLGHVAAILKAVPHSTPWRMGAGDYAESLRCAMSEGTVLEPIPDTPWDPQLSVTMRERGLAGYEESLLPLLLKDLQSGSAG